MYTQSRLGLPENLTPKSLARAMRQEPSSFIEWQSHWKWLSSPERP